MALNFDISKIDVEALRRQRAELHKLIFSDPQTELWDLLKLVDIILAKLDY